MSIQKQQMGSDGNKLAQWAYSK